MVARDEQANIAAFLPGWVERRRWTTEAVRKLAPSVTNVSGLLMGDQNVAPSMPPPRARPARGAR
jgi:hypothetical protein